MRQSALFNEMFACCSPIESCPGNVSAHQPALHALAEARKGIIAQLLAALGLSSRLTALHARPLAARLAAGWWLRPCLCSRGACGADLLLHFLRGCVFRCSRDRGNNGSTFKQLVHYMCYR